MLNVVLQDENIRNVPMERVHTVKDELVCALLCVIVAKLCLSLWAFDRSPVRNPRPFS